MKWTKEMRKAASKRMKAYHRSKNVQAVLDVAHQAQTSAIKALYDPEPIPTEVRDIDSIFFRFRRLSRQGRDFVMATLKGVEARTDELTLIATGQFSRTVAREIATEQRQITASHSNGALATTN